MALTEAEIAAAIEYNDQRGITARITDNGPTTAREFAEVTELFQEAAGLRRDGQFGPATETASWDVVVEFRQNPNISGWGSYWDSVLVWPAGGPSAGGQSGGRAGGGSTGGGRTTGSGGGGTAGGGGGGGGGGAGGGGAGGGGAGGGGAGGGGAGGGGAGGGQVKKGLPVLAKVALGVGGVGLVAWAASKLGGGKKKRKKGKRK